MKILKFISVIIFIFMTGCGFFKAPGSSVAPIAVPWVCQYSGVVDVSQDLAELKKKYIDQRNFMDGEKVLSNIIAKVSCSTPAVYRAMFSYSINNPLPGQQPKESYCVSVSILEDEERNPYFEEWAACNAYPTAMNYLIDFNNITTDNKSINQNLRIRNVFSLGYQFKNLISQRIMTDLIIHDNDEFLFEAIGFDVGISESVMEHFYVISAF